MTGLWAELRRASLPRPPDSDRLRTHTERWRETCANHNHNGDSGAVEPISDDEAAENLLLTLFAYSPYLTSVCLAEPATAADIMRDGPDATIAGEISRIANLHRSDCDLTDRARVTRELRVAKRRIALAIAMGDIAGTLPLERVTGALSEFAEIALQAATRSALAQAAAAGRLELTNPKDPGEGNGLFIIAMGKLGARELNYSSDIDLIVMFDPSHVRGCVPEDMQKTMTRVTREIVRLMDERTADGYVFRTDLRLRPDPGATPIAVSVPAAEIYYESQGQNWERAAMIKARVLAGDIDAGQSFLTWLTPFVWRKNLDFAAIQDIHSIKRQINAHRGGASISLHGHNIKIGRGGIREIEFFAQTQQLIWGGRWGALRVPATLNAVTALVDAGLVSEETRDDLAKAYAFLRTTEHRLQMIRDEQTQTLPEKDEDLEDLARFLGYQTTHEFSDDLIGHLRCVEHHYARLFEEAPSLGGETGGNLVFTGGESDPETLETLAGMGFSQAETIDGLIRGWHHGRYRATRSVRARELLTELMPRLLEALSQTADPDFAFQKFDEFLAGLPAGIQLFSMIHSYPQLLDLLAEVMGGAPRLAAILSKRASLLDAVLSSDFLNKPGAILSLKRDLDVRLGRADDFESALDASRRWTNDQRFLIGLQSLKAIIKPPEAAWALSNVAQTAITAIKPAVEQAFAERHGVIEGESFCTLAFGKLGGHEMTPTSDLDLVFIYPGLGEESSSDGDRPLSRTQYFARLGQRYINAITSPTAEGILYEVDMRLRPSGNAGPIACSLPAFESYHADEAWTWERMALTRARAVNGPAPLKRRVNQAIRTILTTPLDPESLRADVASMRQRMDATHHTDDIWSIKHLRGGLVDLEFIIQYLQLRHASESPGALSTNTWRAMRNLEDLGHLPASDAAVLKSALDLWQALQSQLHLSVTMDPDKAPQAKIPEALRRHLADLGGVDRFDQVETVIRETAESVFRVFERLIGEP